MGDTANLVTKLEAFMEQMATRQRALEEQMVELSISVRDRSKGVDKNKTEEEVSKINGDQGSSGVKGRSESQIGGTMVPRTINNESVTTFNKNRATKGGEQSGKPSGTKNKVGTSP
ncbi:hypothetical protein POM88_015316 [Heracleum sosnowskyi]|uniref:Uncharacterized protein n=1 Tax=Heracleum sosnowskyi TaxID=360622 RepID=A0AAD8MXA6_9APIA|nr:hypothetical protein POM88_015316 [Heracleum sosnowskyi]